MPGEVSPQNGERASGGRWEMLWTSIPPESGPWLGVLLRVTSALCWCPDALAHAAGLWSYGCRPAPDPREAVLIIASQPCWEL